MAVKYDKRVRVIFAGLGGHGALAFGELLTEAAARSYKYVSFVPNYSPMMRGGESETMIAASQEEIDSPVWREADVIIVTSPTGFRVAEQRVSPGGILIVDDSVVREKAEREDIKVFYIPARRIACETGDPLTANFILMGAYLEATKAFPVEILEETIESTSKGTSRERLLSANKRALHEGINLIANYKEQPL
ncbi:MAG: 2-oxoacid:ferredoxin oxidoreductase subunit gamma [Deltaproteobacteria bacterium]|jgi:2-oxoglutarate ferredoxin oxidoreductase subunit gamma|nr:MAG: 2-oxoacid:ferredoxin oxidoreductase subunit gamma [Deltaproteobacteria bacterium]